MEEKKRRILEQLQRGEITAEEAEKLLEAIDENQRESFQERMEDYGRHMSEFIDDFGERMSELGETYGPKAREFAKDVTNKTDEIIDDFVKEVNSWFK